MSFKMPKYEAPDFSKSEFASAPDVTFKQAQKDGVPPRGFHLSSAFPEHYKVKGEWILPEVSVPFCAVVLNDDTLSFVECQDIKSGDAVVMAHKRDGSEGVYTHVNAFPEAGKPYRSLPFEESESEKYEYLFELMRYHKENGGHIVWVMGPAAVFNYDSRIAFEELTKAGFVNAVLAGNALATHDLEGGYLNTALGQNIYTQEAVPNGHYNHLDTINECRRIGSIEGFVESGEVKDGLMKTLVEMNIPYVLAGSIRDDGPLPPVHHTVTDSFQAMRKEMEKATLVINLATLLHSVAGTMFSSSYHVKDGVVEPVFVYTVDITSYAEDSVAKVRNHYLTRSFTTNVQDFVFILKKGLVGSKKEAR